MKKILFMISLLLGGALFQRVFAIQQNIPLQIIKEGSAGPDIPLAPPRPWYITQDDYVLTLPSFEDGFTLELRDESDTVVYSTYVSAGTTTVVLPSTLSGEYELRLIPFSATYYYRGYLFFS